MPRHREKRHLPYHPDQMYDLVADIRAYADFIPWITAVRMRDESDTEATADLIVGFKAFKDSFTSRVKKKPKTAIDVDYVDGPLKHLTNAWRFESDGKGGSIIDFEVDFSFKNRLFEAMAGQLFEKALTRMIGLFEARAVALYGSGSGSDSADEGPSGNSSSSAQITA